MRANCCIRSPRVLSGAEVLALQAESRKVHVAGALLDYVQALVARTRASLALGLSPRAAQGLVRAAQAWAMIHGEAAVLPEHVQIVFPAIAAHRLETRAGEAATSGSQMLMPDPRHRNPGLSRARPLRAPWRAGRARARAMTCCH